MSRFSHQIIISNFLRKKNHFYIMHKHFYDSLDNATDYFPNNSFIWNFTYNYHYNEDYFEEEDFDEYLEDFQNIRECESDIYSLNDLYDDSDIEFYQNMFEKTAPRRFIVKQKRGKVTHKKNNGYKPPEVTNTNEDELDDSYNDEYYDLTDGHSATRELCEATLCDYPPYKMYSVGVSQDGQAISFLSILEGCPDADTLYIGLLLVHEKFKRNSIGTMIMKALFTIARYHAPSIIFMDEIDAIMSQSASSGENPVGPRLRQEILTQMQGVGSTEDISKHVVVLAATNHPWNLDEALRRRLEKRIYLPLPELETRIKLLELKMKGCAFKIDPNLQMSRIGKLLDGYSGSDIGVIVREANLNIVRKIGYQEFAQNKEKYLTEITFTETDFEDAIKKTKPSVN